MKILHVTPFYEPAWAHGGIARASAGLCRALARRGHEVSVATALLEGDWPRSEFLGGVHVRRFAGPAWLRRRLLPWASGLRAFLTADSGTFDVVHIHGHRNGLAVVAARALASCGRSWVLSTHGTFPHHRQYVLAKALFDRLAGSFVVRGAGAMIALSDCEARDLPRPARVVANGVEACERAVARPATRPNGRRRLLFVGNDRLQKRGQLLPALLAAVPEADLQLVGPMSAGFIGRFAHLSGRVNARGVLASELLEDAYAQAELLVHPAVGEAFGLIPFEAALAGTAAVVAGGHGCGEWYGRAGGCVIPPDDPAALAAAVRARLDQTDLARREAQAVAQFARERLTWDQAALATESIYESLAGGPR